MKKAKEVVKPAVETGPILGRPDGSVKIQFHVKPGAKQSKVTDITEHSVGLQIAAPPRDGEANEEVVRFVASIFGIRPRQVDLVAGLKSRDKTVLVYPEDGSDANVLKGKLEHDMNANSR